MIHTGFSKFSSEKSENSYYKYVRNSNTDYRLLAKQNNI